MPLPQSPTPVGPEEDGTSPPPPIYERRLFLRKKIYTKKNIDKRRKKDPTSAGNRLSRAFGRKRTESLDDGDFAVQPPSPRGPGTAGTTIGSIVPISSPPIMGMPMPGGGTTVPHPGSRSPGPVKMHPGMGRGFAIAGMAIPGHQPGPLSIPDSENGPSNGPTKAETPFGTT